MSLFFNLTRWQYLLSIHRNTIVYRKCAPYPVEDDGFLSELSAFVSLNGLNEVSAQIYVDMDDITKTQTWGWPDTLFIVALAYMDKLLFDSDLRDGKTKRDGFDGTAFAMGLCTLLSQRDPQASLQKFAKLFGKFVCSTIVANADSKSSIPR